MLCWKHVRFKDVVQVLARLCADNKNNRALNLRMCKYRCGNVTFAFCLSPFNYGNNVLCWKHVRFKDVVQVLARLCADNKNNRALNLRMCKYRCGNVTFAFCLSPFNYGNNVLRW